MSLLVNLSAVIAVLPIALFAIRPQSARDLRFWLAVAVAAAGAVGWSLVRFGDSWDVGLGAALWVSVAATVLVFALISAISATMARMAGLLGPYLLLVALLATLLDEPGRPGAVPAPAPWVVVHVAVSLATYALATLAAVAGIAVFLKERALKAKHPVGPSGGLPAVADAETLLFALLTSALVVLGIGIVSGMVLQAGTGGAWLELDHKTVLSLLAFAVVGAVLLAHSRFGLRGKRAARGVLTVYLLLTLAYPGVKAVNALIGE